MSCGSDTFCRGGAKRTGAVNKVGSLGILGEVIFEVLVDVISVVASTILSPQLDIVI